MSGGEKMERGRRIAFISEHASPLALRGSQDAGGQNVYVDEVSRNLALRGHTVDVFTRRDAPDLEQIVEWAPGVRIVHLDAGPPAFVPKDDLWPSMPAFLEHFLRFATTQDRPYDVIHGNFWMSGWVAVEAGRRLEAPVVQIFHAMGATKRRHQGAADTSAPERLGVERVVVRAADRLIAQCPSERAELRDDYAAEAHKVVVIPSAVNAELFRPVPREEARRRIGIDGAEPLIVYVGRMLPRKDVRNVVHALALLLRRTQAIGDRNMAGVRLLLVGGETAEPDPVATPEIGALQRLAAELGVRDRVHFMGKRQPADLRYYYSAADVAVTTPWYEPFGLTPLEAMACGRPVVGSAVGGLTFTIADGETGYLVPPSDPAALAGRLSDLLVRPDLQASMGAAARRRVESGFTWPLVAQRTAELYQSVLSGRRAAVGPPSN